MKNAFDRMMTTRPTHEIEELIAKLNSELARRQPAKAPGKSKGKAKA